MPFTDSATRYAKRTDNPAYIDPAVVQSQAVQGLPPQQKALAQGATAAVGALVTPQPSDLPAVAGGKSLLRMIGDAMNKVEGAGVGFIEGGGLHLIPQANSPGITSPQELGQSTKSGFQRSASYQEALGPQTGVYFDMLAPVSGAAGEGAGQLMRIAGLPLLRAAGRATGSVVPEGLKDAAALVNKPYAYKRMDIPEGLSIESELAGKHHQADLMKATFQNKEIRRLVPDAEGNRRLAMAVEDGDFSNLTANELQAYPLAQQEKNLLEQRRIAGQTINPKTASELVNKMDAFRQYGPDYEKFVSKEAMMKELGIPESEMKGLTPEDIHSIMTGPSQIQYFPHMDLPPQQRIASISKSLAEKKASGGDTTQLESMLEQAKWDAKSNVGQWMAGGRRGRARGFQQERTDLRTLRNKGDALAAMDLDVASVLHRAKVETAKAEANRGFMLDYYDNLIRKPTGVPGESTWMATPTDGYTEWDLSNGGKFQNMPKNIYIRNDVYKSITGAAARIANPDAGMLTGIKVFDAANRLWRNWQLFTRSSTLMNNFVGNVFNNYARLGMGPESVGDYAQAGAFLVKKKLGTLDMNAQSFVKGLTNGQLSDLLEKERITGTGWSHEAGYMSGAKRTAAEKMKGITGPESILLEPGKATFTAIEDWNRAAAYINQLKKGFDPRTAAKNVFDSMFDYELGLTDFEKNVMRRAMPFYSWTRFNVPLQMRMFAEHPERYINMARAARGVGMATTQGQSRQMSEAGMSDWQRESVPIPIGYDPSQGYKMLPSENVLPASQAISFTRNAVKLNPFPIMGDILPAWNPLAQAATNIDFFRSTPQRTVNIQDKSGQQANLLGKNMDARLAYLAQQAPPIRMAEQGHTAYQKAGGGVKGLVAAGKRLTLPYSFTFDPNQSSDFNNRKIAGEIRDLADSIRKMQRITNDSTGYYTKDQKSAANANIKIFMQQIDTLKKQIK